MKKALIFNPYFDTLGGGEKYTSGVMLALAKAGYKITVAWNDSLLPKKISNRFGFDVEAEIDQNGYKILTTENLFQKYRYLSHYDLVFWVSDGSVPFLFGKKNILLFQVPFLHIKKSILNLLKWKMIHKIICYSNFTKKIIDASYGVDSTIIYPPSTLIKILPKRKIILSVGRFDGLLHSKRQDVLIKAFKQLHASSWKLILAGGDMGKTNNLDQLKKLAKSFDIEFFVNPSYQEIEKLYGEATIFWHAAGFDVDENIEPQKLEHFGIATVEAMSAGTVPLVYQAGGQPEIVTEGKNGYLWTTVDELVNKTQQIINNSQLLSTLSKVANKTSTQYSMENFIDEFTKSCIR